MKERHLQSILEDINTPSLISFSWLHKKSEDRYSDKIIKLVPSIIAQANLLKLELNNLRPLLEEMISTGQSMIQPLKTVTFVTLDNVYMILQCLPHLRTFVIRFLCGQNIAETRLVRLFTPFRQLTSLTVEHMMTTSGDLELILSLMPSLTHLRLVCDQGNLEGNRCEQFIQTNLSLLNNFEFFLMIWGSCQHGSSRL
jgi:hypothetical protein